MLMQQRSHLFRGSIRPALAPGSNWPAQLPERRPQPGQGSTAASRSLEAWLASLATHAWSQSTSKPQIGGSISACPATVGSPLQRQHQSQAQEHGCRGRKQLMQWQHLEPECKGAAVTEGLVAWMLSMTPARATALPMVAGLQGALP